MMKIYCRQNKAESKFESVLTKDNVISLITAVAFSDELDFGE